MAHTSGDAPALPGERRQLRLVFRDAAALRAEYARNLHKGGAFVPTRARFEMRELVEVAVELPFAGTTLELTAEIVLCLPPDAVPPGAQPGVAVEFTESTQRLRERIEPFLGPEEPPVRPPAAAAERSSPGVPTRPFSLQEDDLCFEEEGAAREADRFSLEPDESAAPPGPTTAGAAAPSGWDEPLELDGEGGDSALEFDDDDLAALEPNPTDAGLGSERAAAAAPSPLGSAPAPEPRRSDPATSLAALRGQVERLASYPMQHERRDAPREIARLPVRVRTATGREMEARTRDLSRSGVLLSVEGTELPLGRRLTICFVHPASGATLEIPGRAVRHLEGEGNIPATAVRFEPAVGRTAEVTRFVEEVQELEQQRRREGIRGPLAEMDVASLLQMFASCSPRGTVTVSCGTEEGTIVFAERKLVLARLGPVSGLKAFARLLTWRDGEFELRTHVDGPIEQDLGEPLEYAVLDAMRRIEEERKLGLPEISPTTGFEVNREQLLAASPALDKMEEAVLDLAAAGLTMRRVLDVIPDSDAEIRAAVASLVERGILRPTPAG